MTAVVDDRFNTIKCRFGCEDPINMIMVFDQGSTCHHDHLQALCLKHVLETEPVGSVRVVYAVKVSPIYYT